MQSLDSQARRKGLLSRLQRAYRYSELRKLVSWFKGKTVHWSLYLVTASFLLAGTLSVHNYLCGFSYVVWLDRQEAGLVKDIEEVDAFIDELLEKCSYYYGTGVIPEQDITYSWERRAAHEADLDGVKHYLRRNLSFLTEAVLLLVDGNPVVHVGGGEAVEEVRVLLSRAYISQENNVELVEVELTEEICGEKDMIYPGEVYTPVEVVSMLTRQSLPSEELLASRSAGILSRAGRTGDDVDTEIPAVNVKTVEEVTVEERVPFTTTYQYNSNMYSEESRIISRGVDGRRQAAYRITRENGEEVSRELISQEIITHPVAQVVERGTARRFAWPVAGGGRISQYYRGAAHRGIDIAAATGTAVLAAESGVVVKSECVWPMGNYIIIRHDIGYWTVYLHNSKNIVSVGQRVSRGQTIGYIGSTGFSTGPHLHFEVRRCNGSTAWNSWLAHPPVDPMLFFR